MEYITEKTLGGGDILESNAILIENRLKFSKNSLFMFSIVLIGLVVIFSYGMGNVAAAPGDIIYVNGSSGQDTWDGQLAVWNGTSGPKATIKNATGTVNNGGTVNIANGLYTGVNNTNITINKNMIINGQSSDGTIINGNNISSIFTINSGVNTTINNLTLTNGRAINNGGAILNFGNLTVNNCNFTSNYAPNNGGAISSFKEILPVNLTVTNCTFINNTAPNNGGAILGGDTVTNCTFTNNTASNCDGAMSGTTVTNCIFTNNTAGNCDGAMSGTTVTNCIFTNNTAGNCDGAMSGTTVINCTFINNTASNVGGATDCDYGSILNVTNCTFINNTARLGGAICNEGTAEVNFNRIIGNTASSGNDILNEGSLNADNNWWGSNQGPSAGSVDGLTVTEWLVLSITENPSNIISGQTSTITADLLYDNGILNDPNNPELYYHDPSNGCIPDGTPVTFSGNLGSINTLDVTLTDGQAQSIFTSNNSGTGNVTAILDSQSVSAPIMVGPLTVNSIDPLNYSDINNVNKAITITFNLPILAGGSYNSITVTGPSGIVPTTSQINGNILTLTPTSSYTNGNYYVNIPLNAVTDLAGNNLTTTFNSNFTIDTVPPTIKTIIPTNNAINIPTNQVIKITFSKTIKAGNMDITLTNSKGTPVTITTSINGNILTINHKALLTNGKYTLTLHTGSITDLAGNSQAIMSSSFTVDSIPPTIKTITPAKNAIKVPTNQIIKVTFSEPIKAGNMVIELKTSTGKEISFTRTISGNTLTIKSKSLLSKGIKYTLILHTGSVTDLANNNLATYSSSFTTV